jgi:methylthioribose-1-phosphate isomerase
MGARKLLQTRPTAVNLAYAVNRVLAAVQRARTAEQALQFARTEAEAIAEEDVAACAAIGRHGLAVIEGIAAKKAAGEPLNILTHCNAGWLAFVDIGSATAPVYAAREAGIPLHVWVDETRPRNQGARLTAWELVRDGVDTTVITDNMAGALMRQGQIDLVVVGADRIAANGDTANKIGTYTVAVLARENRIPFYVAAPLSTIDRAMPDGSRIPIEERAAKEVTHLGGIRLTPEGAKVRNQAFDVTPHDLIAGIITERGIFRAPYVESLRRAFEDSAPQT